MFLVVKWSRQKDKSSLSSPAVLLVPPPLLDWGPPVS